MSTLIKITQDGRKVEVIEQAVYLDGQKEAELLVPIAEHPNRANILAYAPDATHMAGRIALTAAEATTALVALEQARLAYENSPKGLAERIRRVQNHALAHRDG